MPYCEVNNVRLYYEVQGQGEAIVFTHGASWNHEQWKPQVSSFSKKYKTITWDIRGHGLSSLPAGRVDAKDFTADLIGLLDHLQIDKANLCGLSAGSHISIQTALRNPDRVKSLIMIATPLTNGMQEIEKLWLPFNHSAASLLPMHIMAMMQASTLSHFNPANWSYIMKVVPAMPKSRWNRLWEAISSMDSGVELQRISCPALILYGEHDTVVYSQQSYLQRSIFHSQIREITHAGHATNLDNPIEVNKRIEKFLLALPQ